MTKLFEVLGGLQECVVMSRGEVLGNPYARYVGTDISNTAYNGAIIAVHPFDIYEDTATGEFLAIDTWQTLN